jgi:hypothetical protein
MEKGWRNHKQAAHDHDTMHHDHHHHTHDTSLLKKYKPVIIAFIVVAVWTVARALATNATATTIMTDFMGGFFIVFGGLKLLGYKGFTETFPRYDIIASRSKLYTYAYPFIELMLGVLFIWNIYPLGANIVTFFIMTVGAFGVYKTLKQGVFIQCACMGSLFTIPLSKVTLFEDVLMAAMALGMIFRI